ncbi:MAG: O-antigen ligase domain-containing protein [Gemmatimonadetes bacterium]|nr:MAG: O-antigen ligase domain-containing protein [Gemmatimonadota bacterium]
MLASLYFSGLRVKKHEIFQIFLFILIPIMSLVILASFTVFTTEDIIFTHAAVDNKITSLGFAPNQVSAIMGLGAFVAFLCLFIVPSNLLMMRYVLIFCIIWCFSQSALTFSRGGVYNALGAIVAASLYLIRDKKITFYLFFGFIITALLLNFVIFPKLDEFTSGNLGKRFGNIDPTGRDDIAKADLLIFQEHPLFGVGLGQSPEYHILTFHKKAASHTEPTRMLAEHGSFGLLALLVLVLILFSRLTRKTSPLEKAVIVSVTIWAFLYMGHAAMRLAAPALLFGLGSITLDEE